jgi:hypothetical protein
LETVTDAVLISMIGGGAVVMASAITGATAFLTRKLDEIHVLVNSNLETVKKDLAGATKQIARLEQLLAARDEPAGDY